MLLYLRSKNGCQSIWRECLKLARFPDPSLRASIASLSWRHGELILLYQLGSESNPPEHKLAGANVRYIGLEKSPHVIAYDFKYGLTGGVEVAQVEHYGLPASIVESVVAPLFKVILGAQTIEPRAGINRDAVVLKNVV